MRSNGSRTVRAGVVASALLLLVVAGLAGSGGNSATGPTPDQVTLSLAPDSVRFTGTEGDSAAAPATVELRPSGAGSIGGLSLGAVTYGAGQPTGWLTVGTLSSTTATATTAATVTLTARPGTLGPGAYTASLPVSSNAGGRTIAIALTVDPLLFAQLAPGLALGHTCGLTAAGVAYCWGAGGNGQLGLAAPAQVVRPIRIADPVGGPTGVTYAQLVVGERHTCGRTSAGVVYCWGANGQAQLGDGTQTNRSTPVRVQDPVAGPAGLLLVQVSAGGSPTRAATPTGVGYCWRSNAAGQLGDGSTTLRTRPVTVANPVGSSGVAFASLVAGERHTCGVARTTGHAFCWGDNVSGAVGDASTTDRPAPVRVADPVGATTGISFDQVAAGAGFTCGVPIASFSSSVHCWGSNTSGRLGDGTTMLRVRPTPTLAPDGGVSGLYVQLVTAATHACVRTSTSVAYCWGRSDLGALGDGTTTDRLRPVRVRATP